MKIAIINGIEVYHVPSEKFKTNSINVFFLDDLSEANVTKNALLPAVLKRGCKKYPTFQEISLYLESLYGATFEYAISKKGEKQIIQFYMDIVADQYTHGKETLFEQAFDFLLEFLAHPLKVGQSFKEEYVVQEKENLKKYIDSRVNDKMQYAVDKCLEVMTEKEAYSVYEYGRIDDLSSIDGKSLYQHWEYFLETLPIRIFISGNVEDEKIQNVLQKLSLIKRNQTKELTDTQVHTDPKDLREFTETMNVSQGKLCLGFRTNTAPQDKAYFALMVYNGILGGGIHSKLFQNVREKNSLAYYAYSRLDKFKGLMVISSGIEKDNKEKARKIIFEQLEAIERGEITDEELSATIKTMETGIKSMNDSQLQIVDFYLGQSITKTQDSFDNIIEKIKQVSKEEILEISRRIKPEMIYFLEPGGK